MKALESDAIELAEKVVKLWKEGKNDEAIALCDAKIRELLEAGYSPSTVSKGCQLTYRKAISLEAEQTEYRYTAEPVCFFKVPQELLTATNEHSKDTVEAQRDVLIPITESMSDDLLEVAVRLITQDITSAQSVYEKAVGQSLLTGRRTFSEVLRYAQFEPIDEFNVSFTGQAKGGQDKRDEAYDIPVLGVSSEVIAKAQTDIWAYISSRPWYHPELSDKDFEGKCKKQIDLAIIQHVDPIFNQIRLKGYPLKKLTSHDLRKIYACLCWKIRNRKRSAFTAYASMLLGHNTTNRVSGQTRRDTKTSESYEKFIPVDDDYLK